MTAKLAILAGIVALGFGTMLSAPALAQFAGQADGTAIGLTPSPTLGQAGTGTTFGVPSGVSAPALGIADPGGLSFGGMTSAGTLLGTSFGAPTLTAPYGSTSLGLGAGSSIGSTSSSSTSAGAGSGSCSATGSVGAIASPTQSTLCLGTTTSGGGGSIGGGFSGAAAAAPSLIDDELDPFAQSVR